MFKNVFRPKIEQILGYEITDDEMDSVDDFRCLSDKKITDLKKIAEKDEFFAKFYLEYMATKRNKKHAFSFVVDVKNGIESIKDWMKDAVVVVSYDENDILNLKSIENLIAVLEPFSAQYGFSKIEFDLERWSCRVPYVGALCVDIQEYDYRTKLPAGVKAIADKKNIINKTSNPSVVAMRWVVSYISKLIWSHIADKSKNKKNIEDIYRQRLQDEFKLNSVMRSVTKILEKELELIGGYYTDEIAPGFVLDDEQIKKYL